MKSELRRVYTTVDARDRIIEAALSVFSEVGFAGATMRAIADAADVSPGLIHHHFTDKERLWNLVGERVSEEFLEYLGPALEVEHVDAETIPSILASYMGYWRAHPSALRLQIWRVLGAPEDERRARVKRLNQHVVPMFVRAQEAGFIRRDVPAGQVMVTAGSFIQYRLHSQLEMQDAVSVTGDGLPADEEFLRYVVSLIAAQPNSR